MRLKNLLLSVPVVLALSLASYANTLSLNVVNGNLFQQIAQRPCIFSNQSCVNGGFPSTDVPNSGSETSYDLLSPIYAGSSILPLLSGGSLVVGIDINQATGAGSQTLTRFEMLKNGVVVDTFVGSGPNVPATNNGNGFADFLLSNFSSFVAADTVRFHFVFDNANDGPENVFIASVPATAAPEPASLVLTGLGVLSLGLVLFKRQRRAGQIH